MLKFAFKNMAIKKVQILLIILSIVISAGIGVLAFNVANQVDDGITNNAAYYSVIVGPAGSNTQLAMNSMYFTDSPVGTIPYSVVSYLAQDSRVTSAIPFAMADSYNGYNVVSYYYKVCTVRVVFCETINGGAFCSFGVAYTVIKETVFSKVSLVARLAVRHTL